MRCSAKYGFPAWGSNPSNERLKNMDDQQLIAQDQAAVDAAQAKLTQDQAELKAAQDKLAADQQQAAYDAAHPVFSTFRQIDELAVQVGGDIGAQITALVATGKQQAADEIAKATPAPAPAEAAPAVAA
jgi:hypothetical protein